jgi:hypothetical protein
VKALIIPRPGAEAGDHWYSYVAERVEEGVVPGLVGAEVRAPRPQDADAAGSLILIGHERGADLLADFLSSLPPGHTAAGTLLVAPRTDAEDWHAAGRLRVLLSDDPGYAEAEREWAERRRAEVALRPGGRSFCGGHEISVLINLAALSMEVAEQV